VRQSKAIWAILISSFVLAASLFCAAQKSTDRSLTIVFKDGHQKTFAINDGSRIEFKRGVMTVTNNGRQETIPVADVVRMDFVTPSGSLPLDRHHFAGNWEFGQGPGMGTFKVKLDPDGQAHKDHGAPHGTWVVVDNEARISWDDGWKDIIRKVGNKHEKFAYEPGRNLSEEPSNVSTARRTSAETM
jgi:hypothetical protein